MNFVERKILDRQFTKLIWKSIKADYLVFNNYQYNLTDTPQGSILSPILSNIFMNQLDTFVLGIKEQFDQGIRARVNPQALHLQYLISQAKKVGDKHEIIRLSKIRSTIPPTDFYDPYFKRLSYLRFADEWIVGVNGSYKDTEEIMNRINDFFATIKLPISLSNSKITNLNKEKAIFLATEIKRSQYRMHSHSKQGVRGLKDKLLFLAPILSVRRKLTEASFIKRNKSHPKFVWLHLNHDQIIYKYNSVLRVYSNYYSFTHNYNNLISFLNLILKQSCAKLLATKFGLKTMSHVYKKFGKYLRSPNGIDFIHRS